MGNCGPNRNENEQNDLQFKLLSSAIASSTAAAASASAAVANASSVVALVKQSQLKTSMTLAERKRFILNLDLGPSTQEEHKQNEKKGVSTDKASASVVDGMVSSFAPGVSKLHQSDVKNSMLLAQLAASKQFDREEETINWYRYYVTVLENIGWAITEFNFTAVQTTSQNLQMDKVVLDILAAILTQNELLIATTTLDALKKLPGTDDAVTLFNNSSNQGKNGNFQVGVAREDSDGNVTLSACASYFKAEEHHTRFLWWNWASQDVQMYVGSESVVLDEDVYSQVRQTIINKLGNRATEFVRDIEI